MRIRNLLELKWKSGMMAILEMDLMKGTLGSDMSSKLEIEIAYVRVLLTRPQWSRQTLESGTIIRAERWGPFNDFNYFEPDERFKTL
jgi:hypothetical protein